MAKDMLGEHRHDFFLNPYEDCAFTRCPVCEAPTTARLLTMFDNLQVHDLLEGGTKIQTFLPELSEMQKELLELMEVPAEVYTRVV